MSIGNVDCAAWKNDDEKCCQHKDHMHIVWARKMSASQMHEKCVIQMTAVLLDILDVLSPLEFQEEPDVRSSCIWEMPSHLAWHTGFVTA